MFYNSANSFKFNDCVAHGACSVSPNIASLQEIMFILLKQITYYILKLEELGIDKHDLKYSVIRQIAMLDAAKDLSEEQILNEFSKQYINLFTVHKEYTDVCKERKLDCKTLKDLLKFSPKTDLSSILKKGEKSFLKKYKDSDINIKYLSEILYGVLKSVCINLVRLFEFNRENNEAVDTVLESLNMLNAQRISPAKLKTQIEKLAVNDIELLKLINSVQIENYGEIGQSEVSYSTRPHKAIMVSGSNLCDFASVLEQTKDEDVDVYTNGNLLVAHLFPHFKEYKNLQGHFGNGITTTILDFATFPGAILLTKNEVQNIEYLYRGRLFTTDEISPKGVSKIENNDFSPLIESAKQAKGFAKGQKRDSDIIGYDEEKLNKLLDDITENKYEHVFVIGLSNFSPQLNDYFEKFFSLMPKNSVAISFSYNPNMENVFTINLGNDYSLLYGVLHKIFAKISLTADNLTLFLTKCDISSLSNIINLKSRGAKDIYLSDCPPMVINPTVLKAFSKLFDVHTLTTPKQDLDVILKKE